MTHWLKLRNWRNSSLVSNAIRSKLLLVAGLLWIVFSFACDGKAQTWADPATLTWTNPATEIWQDPLTCVWVPPNLLGWGTVTLHGAILMWMASTTPLVTYNVYQGPISGGPYVLVASGLTLTNFSDSPLTSGTVLYFVVTAFDGMQESVFSNEVQAIIP